MNLKYYISTTGHRICFFFLCPVFLYTKLSFFSDVNDPKWTLHKKHVFVFSEAGKPIYSR